MKKKKIAKAKINDLEVIYFEMEDAYIKEFLGKEDRIVLRDKIALFRDWEKVEELDIFTNEYTIEYLQSDLKNYEYYISTPKLK